MSELSIFKHSALYSAKLMTTWALLAVALFLWGQSSRASSRESDIARIRSVFAKSTQASIQYYAVPKESRGSLPSGYTVTLPLLKEPIDLVTDAINASIREGDKMEVAGALAVYCMYARENKIPRTPAYFQAVRDLLSRDNLDLPEYTNVLAEALTLFPSKESVIMLVDLAGRVVKADQRERYLGFLGDLVGVDIPISTTTTPLEKERMLFSFQSWVERNKNRFEFDAKGRARLAGGDAGGEPRLGVGDRERIRKDPACVLRLMRAMVSDNEEIPKEVAKDLVGRCGAALMGEGGAKTLLEAMEQPPGASELSWDLQARLGSVQGRYPVMDAVLLAIAYVAAYEQDPAARTLARDMLHDLASPEIARVLKGEPRIVHQKIKELDREVTSGEKR